jgi:hypothetical protein
MRFDSTTSKAAIWSALRQMALQTWGPERLNSIAGVLDQASEALWTVLQISLTPHDEEPDLPNTARTIRKE